MIEVLAVGDAARCAAIEREVFAEDSPWPLAAFEAEIAAPRTRYFAARTESGGPLVGYAGIALLGQTGRYECEIHTIAVDPAHRGAGHGRGLLAAVLAVADDVNAEVFLEVRTDNERAMDLYRRNGFTVLGVRKRYYQPSGADAFTMRRDAAVTRVPEVAR